QCGAPALFVEDVKDLVDDLAELADEVGADVEVISVETEEGQMLLKSFGGIAAVLRFKLQG
ncbi:MAG: peptide chain release factor 1, partial [Candidatus Bathyarchaeota archaeon]|nr:peptide chain release factor 1 [Candidatus Bathyarchaeota archaeon]